MHPPAAASRPALLQVRHLAQRPAAAHGGDVVTRPVMLDAFCGAGGAAKGYQRAGFYVIGVDIKPQPNYCGDEFYQADALTVLREVRDYALAGDYPYQAIHASPTCQHHANVTGWRGNRDDHPDLLTPTLRLLADIETPWVVENVPEALPTWDYVLCGSQFGLKVKRHRGFRRGNWSAFEMQSPCMHHRLRPFEHKAERAYADAMGCEWMSSAEARQAIPPAYTEHIGLQLIGQLERAA